MEVTNPHDKFFKGSFKDKENAIDLIKNTLPEKISKNIDYRSIRLDDDSFIDEDLRENFSDLLINTKLKGKACRVYCLVEHKSYRDKFSIFQLLRYMVRIWERDFNNAKSKKGFKFIPIIPVLFIHGKDEWIDVNEFYSLYFDEDDNIKNFIPNFRSIIYDLSVIPADQIKGNPKFVSAMKLMKYIYDKPKDHLEEVFYPIENILYSKIYIMASIYVIKLVDGIKPETIIDMIENKELKEEIMTIEKQLKDEGIVIGIKKEKLKIAKNLKEKDVSIDIIADTTGLSKEQIEKL